jgi:hypothetical protein
VRTIVSVIVPVFNRLQYLRPAIESVFAQTFQDWELLIADDGSDGETLDYLCRLKHQPRVKLLRLAHSGNLSTVHNAAFRETAGEYIAFLDSDDVWMPTKLEMQIASLRSRPDRKWSYTGFRMVDASLTPLGSGLQFLAADGWIIDDLLSAKTTIVQSSLVVGRDLIDKAGPYDEQLPWCGDYELWARFALCSAVDCVPQPLVLVRRHAEHCCDDVAACQDFARALDRIGRSVTSPNHLSILRKRRAVASAILARSQASNGRSMSALATLLASAHYSWPYREWWVNAAGATARALTPARVRRVLRAARSDLKHQHP